MNPKSFNLHAQIGDKLLRAASLAEQAAEVLAPVLEDDKAKALGAELRRIAKRLREIDRGSLLS